MIIVQDAHHGGSFLPDTASSCVMPGVLAAVAAEQFVRPSIKRSTAVETVL